MRLRSLIVLAPLVGCDASSPPDGETLDVRGNRVLIGRQRTLRVETDEHPRRELWRWDRRSDGWTKLHASVKSAAEGPEAAFVVDSDSRLVRIDRHGTARLLENASGKPAPLDDGSVVVSKRLGPGETDLWLVAADGRSEVLAPAPGPDDFPIALGDDRIAFVSGRTSVASVWVVSTRGGPARQLTNRGLVAGKSMAGFVPPPEHVISASPTELVYDSGEGDRWRLDVGLPR